MGTRHDRNTYLCEECGRYVQCGSPMGAPTEEETRHVASCPRRRLRPVYRIDQEHPMIQYAFMVEVLKQNEAGMLRRKGLPNGKRHRRSRTGHRPV